MAAITRMSAPGEAAVRAVEAGADVIVHSPDDAAAAEGLRAAVGERPDFGGAPRCFRPSAADRQGPARAAPVARSDLGDVASHVGGRQHAAVARTVSERGLTLVRNKPRHVPLDATRSTRVLRALGARLSR